jgi:isopentenyl phosphate kinase
MRVLVMGMLVLTLGGCVITDREQFYYTRADVDALNARSECRLLARNLVQIARCDGR